MMPEFAGKQRRSRFFRRSRVQRATYRSLAPAQAKRRLPCASTVRVFPLLRQFAGIIPNGIL